MRPAAQLLAVSLAALFIPGIKAYSATTANLIVPPGLYRVDIDSDTSQGKGTARTSAHLDGATGDLARTTILAGSGTWQDHSKGRSPHTECIRADMTRMGFLGLPQTCTQQTFQPTADGGVHTAACPMGKVKMTMKRLGKDVWEIVSETEQALGAGPTNMSFMRPFLEHQAKYAAREEDRKKAAKFLADLPRLDKEMAAKHVETLKMMSDAERQDKNSGASGPPVSQVLASRTMSVRVRKVLTRISDTCSAP